MDAEQQVPRFARNDNGCGLWFQGCGLWIEVDRAPLAGCLR